MTNTRWLICLLVLAQGVAVATRLTGTLQFDPEVKPLEMWFSAVPAQRWQQATLSSTGTFSIDLGTPPDHLLQTDNKKVPPVKGCKVTHKTTPTDLRAFTPQIGVVASNNKTYQVEVSRKGSTLTLAWTYYLAYADRPGRIQYTLKCKDFTLNMDTKVHKGWNWMEQEHQWLKSLKQVQKIRSLGPFQPSHLNNLIWMVDYRRVLK